MLQHQETMQLIRTSLNIIVASKASKARKKEAMSKGLLANRSLHHTQNRDGQRAKTEIFLRFLDQF